MVLDLEGLTLYLERGLLAPEAGRITKGKPRQVSSRWPRLTRSAGREGRAPVGIESDCNGVVGRLQARRQRTRVPTPTAHAATGKGASGGSSENTTRGGLRFFAWPCCTRQGTPRGRGCPASRVALSWALCSPGAPPAPFHCPPGLLRHRGGRRGSTSLRVLCGLCELFLHDVVFSLFKSPPRRGQEVSANSRGRGRARGRRGARGASRGTRAATVTVLFFWRRRRLLWNQYLPSLLRL